MFYTCKKLTSKLEKPRNQLDDYIAKLKATLSHKAVGIMQNLHFLCCRVLLVNMRSFWWWV